LRSRFLFQMKAALSSDLPEPAETDSRTVAILFGVVFQIGLKRAGFKNRNVPGNFTDCSGLPLEVEPETGADQMLLQIEIKFPLNVSNKPPCVGVSHGN